ncbi:hypothetical protein EA717_19050 [Acinetobacter baumannii]|nr:hypothetical protein EGY13_19520 [Acinetobacter sp. FDAARGOS_493]RSP93973.1 hypothetical protein EA717_19050 [Acinetobacter baumannii]TPV09519.1 hypothetical protein FJV25_18495 [Acinetobacter baumannii]
MARVVSQKMKMCSSCGCHTLHQKNSKKISWLMHFFLTVCTFSIWLWIWVLILIWHAIAKPMTAITNRWICSKCGK